MKNSKIDFVITWVNGNDLSWLEQKKKHAEKINLTLNSDARYRDWEFLKYWFRTVERNAPWVNKIYFITEGHLPDWLNTKNDRLVIINHKDYIDEQFLPTFSANPIEWNYQNIKELSDNFVNFNDDMFINAPVSQEDFFINNLPRDCGIFSPIVPNTGGIASMVLNNLEIINKYFNQRDVLKKNFRKFFNLKYKKHLIKNFCTLPWKPILGFYDNHIPISYSKSYFDKVWNLEEKEIKKTCSHRFRQKDDITHWLVRYFQLCEGHFEPRDPNFGVHYDIQKDFERVIVDIKEQKHKVICLNDGNHISNFDELKANLLNVFEQQYNEKSKFEK